MDSLLKVATPYGVSPITEVIEGFKNAGASDRRYLEFEFYNRFAPYIYKVAIEACRNENDFEDAAKEIVQLTFIKALEKIKSYEFPVNVFTEDHRNNCIKAWLGKIASRIFLKNLAKQQNPNIDIDSIDLPISSIDIVDNDEPELPVKNGNYEKLLSALKTLTVDEQLIIRTYANEECIKSTNHLSPAAMNFLCTTLNTNAVTIRKRKQRILEKINSILFPS